MFHIWAYYYFTYEDISVFLTLTVPVLLVHVCYLLHLDTRCSVVKAEATE